MKVCLQTEGMNKEGERYESLVTIDVEKDFKDFMDEFLEAFKRHPQSAKLNLFYCSCGCCD